MTWVLIAFGLMILSLFFRAASWYWIVRAALPNRPVRRRDVTSATMIGVLMSATLPARLGEPARALSLSRRTGRMRETFPVIIGTLASQTLLNILALVLLGAIIVSTTDLFASSTQKIFAFSFVPLVVLLVLLVAPMLTRRSGSGRLARVAAALHKALLQVRAGLAVFRDPRQGLTASSAQLGAWAIQLASCWALLTALGLDGKAGIGAAAAVLFAVNVTAVVPVTPSNIGIFQWAVISVLSTGWGISHADALAYGVVLQAIEIATAVVLGAPVPGPRGPHLERPAHPGALRLARAAAAEAAAAGRRPRDRLGPRPGSPSRASSSSASATRGSNWRPGAGPQLGDRRLERHRLAVGAGRRHRAERVAAGDDPRLDRDLLAGQAVRVAAAVVVLVRGADDAADLGEHAADPVEHFLALDRVAAHDLPLLLVERARLC